MIQARGYISSPPPALIAQMIMSKDTTGKSESMRKTWAPGAAGKAVGALFTPDELDIYVNKVTLEAYIFHSKPLDYDTLARLEYDPADHSVDVVKTDGTRTDLGVKIQWLVRPYFTKAEEINIVQTKDGQSINGKVIPLLHKGVKKKV